MPTDQHTQSLFLLQDESASTDESDVATPGEPDERLPEALYRLLNIHLVDSLSKGRVQTMAVDGGVALTGRNGQGKTSLLALALMFSGVEPTDVVSKGKDSFIDYYLPNQTSYIVYEYEVPDGSRRLVVAYSNSTADRVRYRFVKSDFRRDMFVSDDNQFILNRDFRRRLAELRISCADRQIDTYLDYRCIIQGWQPHHADSNQRRYLAGMSAEYGFTSYNRPLRHLEKLTKGMFSRQANFDDLQQVVADWVFEGKPSVGIHTDRTRVENWPRDYNAYRQIMTIEHEVVGAVTVREALNAAHERVREFKEKFLILRDHLEFSQAAKDNERTSLERFLSERKDEHEAAAGELIRQIAEAHHQVGQCEKDLHRIEGERQAFADAQVEDKRSRAAQRELLIDEARRIDEQYRLALGAASDIQTQYDAAINEEARRHQIYHAAALTKIAELNSAHRVELDAAAECADKDRRLYDSSCEAERNRIQEQIDVLRGQVGRDEERVNNPPTDPLLINAIELKQDSLQQAAAVLRAAEKTVSAKDQAVDRLQAESAKLDLQIQLHTKGLSTQSDKIQGIQRSHAPDPDSLLHFLRSTRSDWGVHIAKVINPELLHRTDLHPQTVDTSQSLYGITLELDFVAPVDEADDTLLQEMLAEAIAEQEALQSQLDSAVAQQRGLREAIKAAVTELTLARAALGRAQNDHAALDTEIRDVRKELQRKRDAAVSDAVTALSARRAQLESAIGVQREFNDRHQQRHIELASLATAKREAIDKRFELSAGQINTAIADHETSTQNAIKTLRKQQDAALSERGADVEILNALKNHSQQLRDDLSEINGWTDLLNQWHHWLTVVEPEIPAIQEKHDQKQAFHGQLTFQLSAVEETWTRTKREVERQISECNTAASSFYKDFLAVESTLRDQLPEYTPTDRHEKYDVAWQATALRTALGACFQELHDADGALRAKIKGMRGAFSAIALSPPATYFSDRLSNLKDELPREITPSDVLGVVEDWFTHQHEQSRRLLIADARTIFGEIQGLHRELKKFSDRLARFNTAIQSHLSRSSKVFDSLTDLQISIVSAVEDLNYWSIIKKITDDRDQWIKDGDLPDEYAVDHLRALLNLWDIKNGINANFKSLVSIRGAVRENGNLRQFRNRAELENISSNGLSYLVMIILFLGFISKVRGNAPVQLTWCVDELRAIDAQNVVSLCNYLGENHITLCTAFPDPDAETLILFANKYKLDSERRLVHCELAIEGDPELDEPLEIEVEDV
jgi:hypothetical protein